MSKNLLYAQSGGVTPVINAQAYGVIETASLSQDIGKIFAARNGIMGVLEENFIDISTIDKQVLSGLMHTPAGAFGSCRYKLQDESEIKAVIEILQRYEIGYFFYNGGGDSQDTSNKIAEISQRMNTPITCIGIPKTIDNDLPVTDNSPGFGSVAKYVAISTLEASLDVASMCATSTKVFIMEVMGRHAGWIAAASGLANPHIILFPEVTFNADKFCAKVQQTIEQYGYCVIVASEGVKDEAGNFVASSDNQDAFGHAQLGGVAPKLAALVTERLKAKTHWAVCDYLQRAARHIASQTDVDQAYATGKAAVEFALAGNNAIMTTIVRTANNPYQWEVGSVPLSQIANQEKFLPKEYISADGWGITQRCKEYLLPLIAGEAYPPYQDGLPVYSVI